MSAQPCSMAAPMCSQIGRPCGILAVITSREILQALHSTVSLKRARHAELRSIKATRCSQIPQALMHVGVADVKALQALQVFQASQSASCDSRVPQVQSTEVGHGCYAEDAPVTSVSLRQVKVPQAGHVPEQVLVRQLLAACSRRCAIRWLAEGNAITQCMAVVPRGS